MDSTDRTGQDEGEQALALAAELRDRVSRERGSIRALKEHLTVRAEVEDASRTASDLPSEPVGEGVQQAPGGTPLRVTTRGTPPGDCLLEVAGEVDADVVPWLRQVLVDVVDAGAARVSLDLSQVSFMDSAGLGAVLHARRWALAAERGFEVVAVSPALLRLLRVTGLHAVLLPTSTP